MRNEAISKDTWPEAVELLCEGFVGSTADFWNRGLERWSKIVDDPFAGPVGYLTRDQAGDAQAVILTFRSPLPTVSDSQPVNTSSWYVRGRHRLFAVSMLKGFSEGEGVTFTDFSPSESVQKMLDRIGYRSLELRQVVFPLHVLSVIPSARVLNAEQTLAALTPNSAQAQRVKDHLAVGCTVFGIQTDTGISPVILRLVTRKRVLRSAEILYAEHTDDLLRALPGIARKLVLRGVSLIECSLPKEFETKLPYHDRGGLARFVKGPWPEDCIDYSYSEMPILGV